MAQVQLPTENLNKSTIEALRAKWAQLNRNQRRFVVAMQDAASKKEAAVAIGVEPNTAYGWPDVVDEVIELMSQDALDSARAMRRAALIEAMAVKLAGLDSGDERVRQSVATEIIEGELGKATNKVEASGPDGDPLRVIVEYVDDDEMY